MDFSSDILVSLALNIIGYLVAAALVAIILRNRKLEKEKPEPKMQTRDADPEMPPVRKQESPVQINDPGPEYISFSEMPRVQTNSANKNTAPDHAPVKSIPHRPPTRQENRRAIYREARKLLAKGKTRDELLHRLPVTENELEMLTVAKRA
jgi:hypothetical protein